MMKAGYNKDGTKQKNEKKKKKKKIFPDPLYLHILSVIIRILRLNPLICIHMTSSDPFS